MDKKKLKKIQKLIDRIDAIQIEMTVALTKKKSDQKEINLSAKQDEIQRLRKELTDLQVSK